MNAGCWYISLYEDFTIHHSQFYFSGLSKSLHSALDFGTTISVGSIFFLGQKVYSYLHRWFCDSKTLKYHVIK